MITTTSYGTWLPGDSRWYVQEGKTLPPSPPLQQHASSLLKKPPVLFSEKQQLLLFESLGNAADEFEYRLTDLSIESWHLHWIVFHDDPVKTMAGRLKNRMRQALAIGRIWTDGYHFNDLATEEALEAATQYIASHAGVRMTDGRIVAPGSAGG